jgi:subtilisin family serine protease
MKRLTLVLFLALLLASTLVSAMNFDPDWFQSGVIMTCFKMESIGNTQGKIDFTLQNGVVHTNMATFNALAEKYNIIDLKQAHSYVKVPTWTDEGRFLQCIYRVVLADNKNMDAAVAELEKDPNVLFAEFETINRMKYVPNDPLITQQYALGIMKCYEAWDYVTGGDVIVGIADSGVKYNHPDLQANIWVNTAELPGVTINWAAGTITGGDGIDNDGNGKVDDVLGWDYFNSDNNPYQNYVDNDHGTHVSGCAGAVIDNGIGGCGSGPSIQIMCLKGASNTAPSTNISNGYLMMQYAAENGAAVVNASWGGPASNLNYPNSIIN